jgi:hypothetical protein
MNPALRYFTILCDKYLQTSRFALHVRRVASVFYRIFTVTRAMTSAKACPSTNIGELKLEIPLRIAIYNLAVAYWG